MDPSIRTEGSQVQVFTELLAAWASAFTNLTGRDEICVWYHFDERVLVHTRSMIGNFLNFVPIVISGLRSGSAQQILENTISAYEESALRSTIPFQGLVDYIEPGRRSSDPAQLQFSGTSINFNDKLYSMSGPTLTGINSEALGTPEETDSFVLPRGSRLRSVWGQEVPKIAATRHSGGRVTFTITYNACLFSSTVVAELRDEFISALLRLRGAR